MGADQSPTVWLVGAGAVVAVGLVGAAATVPTGALVASAVCAALLGVVVFSSRAGCRGEGGQVTVRPFAVFVGASAVAGVTLVGLVGAAGPLGVVLAALAAATSPPVRQWAAKRSSGRAAGLGRRPGGGAAAGGPSRPLFARPPTEAAPQPEPEPSTMTCNQLCLAWRASFTALQRAGTVAEHRWVAERRRGLLDELERRDPAGFERWFASGARAASDPARYLSGRAGARPMRSPRPGADDPGSPGPHDRRSA